MYILHPQELFADPRAAAATTGGGNGNGSWQGQEDEDFWVVVRAIKGFVEHEGKGKLPLSGAIPGKGLEVLGCFFVAIVVDYVSHLASACTCLTLERPTRRHTDMASSTENYSALQAVYREQGAADRRAVLQRYVGGREPSTLACLRAPTSAPHQPPSSIQTHS
jgi:hypothetical protein